MDQITNTNFNLTIGNKILLQNTKLTIIKKNRYGIIGPNGCGKSTLLNYIYNTYHKTLNIVHVEQEFITSNDDTIINILLTSHKKRNKLVSRLNELEHLLDVDDTNNMVDEVTRRDNLLEEYNQIQESLAYINNDSLMAKAQSILIGLGFAKDSLNNFISSFSGGWRMRVSLARALFMEPSYLLLDEPTNHLDLEALIWLNNYITKNYQKTIIIVSHDKNFLNNICTNIILVENQGLHYFKGNYDDYCYQKKIFDIENANKYQKLTKKIKQLAQTKNKQKNSKERDKIDAKVEPLVAELQQCKPVLTKKVNFDFVPVSKNIKGPMLNLIDISFGYDNDIPIIKNINFDIYYGSKIILVGVNGSGKSTLLKLMNGMLIPTTGTINKDAKVRIGYYSQHHDDFTIDTTLTPITYLKSNKCDDTTIYECNKHILDSKYLNANDTDKTDEFLFRRYLGVLGLENTTHKQPINTLSGGQKSRVSFSNLFVKQPHLVLLDEPTNHLDLETVEALINCINNFNGACIIITHNIDLINKIEGQIWELDNGRLTRTTFEDYSNKILLVS